jgi:hypothetical protein
VLTHPLDNHGRPPPGHRRAPQNPHKSGFTATNPAKPTDEVGLSGTRRYGC